MRILSSQLGQKVLYPEGKRTLTDRAFDADDERFLTTLASQASTASQTPRTSEAADFSPAGSVSPAHTRTHETKEAP